MTQSGHRHNVNFHMTANNNIPWKRLSVEAVAIVGSILLAFAIDAWWQERIEESREREILIALLDDFRNSMVNIEEGRAFHLGVQQSNERLLTSIVSDDISLSDAEIDKVLGALTWWDSQSRFSTGALNSLVFGGELSIIKDDALRQILADWPSEIQRAESLRNQDYDFFLSVMMPYLRKNGYLLKISTIADPKPGGSGEESTVIKLEPAGNFDHSSMVSTTEFQNILVQKYWIQDDMLRAFDRAETLLRATIDQIKSNM